MTNLLFLFLLIPNFGEARSIDPDGKSHAFTELDLRYFKKLNNFRFISELRVRNRFENRIYSHIKLGGNYRLSRFFKMGLYYRGQVNNRNPENWGRTNSGWQWDESENGLEHVLATQLIGRTLLGTQFRGELRAQYEVNTSNGQETLRLRPNLTYFWMRDGKHFGNLYVQYEQFLPLNFGNHEVNQKWTYLGFLYSMNDKSQVGVHVAFVEWDWSSSVEFKQVFPNDSYNISDQAFLLGFSYLFNH